MSHSAAYVTDTDHASSDPSSLDAGNTSDSNIDPVLREPRAQSQGAPSNTLVIDLLMKALQLPPQRKKDLEGVFQIAAKDPEAIPRPYILLALYSLGSLFASESRVINKINELMELIGAAGEGNLLAVLTELTNRLEDSWTLTIEQTRNVKIVVQEFIYKAGRTKFKGLHTDIMKRLRQKADMYRLGGVFGRSQRERILTRAVKTNLSNVRNNFRLELARSLHGAKQCTLQKFTNTVVARYNLTETSNSQGYLIQFALLRAFARNQGADLLDDAEEEVENTRPEPESDSESEDDQPAKKKQKVSSSVSGRQGRVADGKDFWGKVDTWMKEKTDQWGDDFNNPGWKTFIDGIMAAENRASQPQKAPSRKKKPKPAKTASELNIHGASPSSSSSKTTGSGDWLNSFA